MTTQTQPETTKTPTHTIYVIEGKEGAGKSEWHKAGVAWENSDKEGLNLSFNLMGIAYLKANGSKASFTVRRNKPQEPQY